jgi:hypothetical protein
MNKDELLEVIKAEAMESIIRDALLGRVKRANVRFWRVYRNYPYEEDHTYEYYIKHIHAIPLTEEEISLYHLCKEYGTLCFPLAPDGVSTLFRVARGQR